MRTLVVAVVLAALVGGTTIGAAASLDVADSVLSGGSASVSSCDTDGVDVQYHLTWREGFAIDRLTVDGIDDACIGLHLSLVFIVNGFAIDLGSATVPATRPDANAVVIDVTQDIPAADVEVVHIAIT